MATLKMFRIYWTLAVFLIIAAALSACGNGSPPSATPPPDYNRD